jgi:hypothetical protein
MKRKREGEEHQSTEEWSLEWDFGIIHVQSLGGKKVFFFCAFSFLGFIINETIVFYSNCT